MVLNFFRYNCGASCLFGGRDQGGSGARMITGNGEAVRSISSSEDELVFHGVHCSFESPIKLS